MKKQVLILVGFLATAGQAFAQAPEAPPGAPRGPRPPLDRAAVKRELGLNDEQMGQLQKLRMDQRKAAIRRRADVQLARLSLQELMQAPTVDEKAVQARVKELADLQAGALRARIDGALALRKILTPEQIEKLRQLRPERAWRNPGGRGGPGPGRGLRGRGPVPPPGADEQDEDAQDELLSLTGGDGR